MVAFATKIPQIVDSILLKEGGTHMKDIVQRGLPLNTTAWRRFLAS